MNTSIIDDNLTLFKRYCSDPKNVTFEIILRIIDLNRLTFLDYLNELHLLDEGALRVACLRGNYDVYSRLICYGFKLSSYHIDDAIIGGNLDILQDITKRPFNTIQKHEAIAKAVQKGSLEMVKMLVHADFHVNPAYIMSKVRHRINEEPYHEILYYLHSIRDEEQSYGWGCKEGSCGYC